MPIRIKSIFKELADGSTETELGEITVKSGHRYNVLEILPVVPSNSWLYVYIESDRVAEIHGDLISKDNRRIVVNWSLGPGTKLKVSGTNASGAAAKVGAIIIYDDVTA